MSTERDAFDAWCGGLYRGHQCDIAWAAWQARAALEGPPGPVETLGRDNPAASQGVNPAPLRDEPAAPVKVCRGIPRVGCNYFTECDHVCNKCGEVHDWAHIQPWPAHPPSQPPREPLSDEQIAMCMLAVDDPLAWGRLGAGGGDMVRQFARAVLAAAQGGQK